MNAWSAKNKRNRTVNHDRRYGFMIAMVFLLSGMIIAQLVYIQLFRHDYFLAAAAEQHQSGGQIAPARGRIYFQDRNGESADGLFPIASNKELTTIYAIPRDLADEDKVVGALYEFFKKPYVESEVDAQLKLEETDRLNKQLAGVDLLPEPARTQRTEEARIAHNEFIKDQTYLESKQAKREQMIEERKTAILNKYRELLANKAETYRVLERRVDYKIARDFHLALVDKNILPPGLGSDDLEINNGRMRSAKVSIDKEGKYPLDFAGIGYETELYRVYPENNIASQVLGFVSFDSETVNGKFGRHGRYGLEGYFDDELFGQFGEVKSERGAGGVLITANRDYKSKIDGDDLVLTIDRTVEFMIAEKIKEATLRYAADSGTIVIMDPNSGAIIAMASYPDFDPNNYDDNKEVNRFNNPAIFENYEPGSVFKAVTMAAAMNEGKVTPDSTYVDKGSVMIQGWPKAINNADTQSFGAHGVTTMTGVLEKSLNTGAIYAMQAIGEETFADYVEKFGFGEKTGIELQGESSGNITLLKAKTIKPIDAATASFGQGSIVVTPIQMLTAYAAIANGGRLVKPFLVKEIRHADGTSTVTSPGDGQQIITRRTSSLLTGMLINVVEKGHAVHAQVPGYYIAGKTGTAQIPKKGQVGYVDNAYNHTFITFAPADNPKFVMLVKFTNPKGITYADSTTVPVARDIMSFLFNYWQIPKNR